MPSGLLLAILLLAPRLALACDPAPAAATPFDGLCAVLSGPCTRGPRVAVISAFPGEQRMLRATAEVTERLEIRGRSVVVGQLGGQQVALTLSGIGLANATASATALVGHLDLSAIVFSGVAGSPFNIGDVTVPATWNYVAKGQSFPVDPALLADAQAVGASDLALDRCTPVPPEPPGDEVCLLQAPRVVVGGVGESSDPFGTTPVQCVPDGGEIFGCEARFRATEAEAAEQGSPPDATDEETAAVAEVAAANGLPFIAARGVSDGAGDPLGLPGFPAQFFAYYHLAADNAAAVVVRLLEMQPAPEKIPARHARARSRPAAACAFERAAGPSCQGVSAPRRVGRLVSRACALRARAADAVAPRAGRLVSRAAARWRRAATLVERGDLPSCCAADLAARLRAAAGAVSAEHAARRRIPR